MNKILIALMLAIVLVSCQKPGNYQLTSFVNGMANYAKIRMELTSDQLYISGGCNTIRALYSVAGSAFTVGSIGITKMLCPVDNDADLVKQL